MSHFNPIFPAGSARRNRAIRAASSLVLFAALAAGCSSDTIAQAERQPAPTAVPAPAGVGADGSLHSVEVVDGGSATGLVLTDHRGFAVYGLSGETQDDLVCVDDCISAWPPLAPRDLAGPAVIDLAKLEFMTRPDGIDQVVYAGVPLYLWTGDTEVGITGGAGVAGTWFALTETGGFL